jgi:predicted restriction endonuclease
MLSNVICLCRFHDALFEQGYWSLANDLSVTKICGRRLNYAASSNPWASAISGTKVDVPYTR